MNDVINEDAFLELIETMLAHGKILQNQTIIIESLKKQLTEQKKLIAEQKILIEQYLSAIEKTPIKHRITK